MTSENAVVLDAATGEADRIQLEAALASCLADGRYRVEVDPSVVNDLAVLVRSQGPHAPAVDTRRLQSKRNASAVAVKCGA